MKKLIVFGLIVTVLFAGGIAFFMKPSHDMGSSTNNQKQPVNSDPNAVSIQGFSFKLADKVIKKGTTIT